MFVKFGDGLAGIEGLSPRDLKIQSDDKVDLASRYAMPILGK
jgi:hypothetical protein